MLRLELAPGAVVNERELMLALGLGRTPVREALRRLATERLVEVYPRRGTLVSAVNVHDLSGLSEVRQMIEPAAARLAAERATPEQRTAIDGFIAELERLAMARDERTLIELDQRLHRHIWACAHNEFMEGTLEEFYVLTLRIWLLVLGRVERLDEALLQHRALLEAIRDGRATDAEGAMRVHVIDFERSVRAVL
ncbi:MAG: GntR family transcriptional regulator [Thermoleophilia bacterium]|nr:GntR family transcriptional regulator [Thermoleophilia bacterium]